MSTQVPQVLSRKANGSSNGTTSQVSEPVKGNKSTEGTGNSARLPRGKGAAEKRGGSSKATNDGETTSKPPRSRAHNEGEKLVVRRLPPGMTREEFVSILGTDWAVSKDKVDWMFYASGKVSTDPSKPSRPSRAYIHLKRKDDIMSLSETVRSSTWEDAKSTFTSPALIGPPTLEFSVYKKVPSTKRRTDARQGTIDQDPEFMAFLEGLANPAPMRDSIDVDDAADAAKADTKSTTTPLIEYLKEKKANKGKDGSGKNKSGGKGKGGSKDDESGSGKKKGKEPRGEKTEKAPKETVKIMTKKVATEQAAEAARKAASQIAATNASTTATADAPKSRRAGIAAAARILQRDLGLSPGSAHRRARHDAAKAEADVKGNPSSSKENKAACTDDSAAAKVTAAAAETAPAASSKAPGQVSTAARSQSGRRSRGGKDGADKAKAGTANENAPAQPTAANPPVILKKKNDSDTNAKSNDSQPTGVTTNGNGNGNASSTKQATKEKGNSGKSASQKKTSTVSANATRAFVKNVTASQGVNNASLREALGAFGTITLVEIDKRKGFAYVDFAEHDSLVRAVASSPIQIGQAAVQVLERKDKKPTTSAAATTTSGKEEGKDGNAGTGDKEKPSGGRGRRGRGSGKAASAANNQTAEATTKEAPANKGG